MRAFPLLILIVACGPSLGDQPTTTSPSSTATPVAPAPTTEPATEDEPSLPERPPETTWELAGIALPTPVSDPQNDAWAAARKALELRLPYLPSGLPMETVNAWAQGPFKDWVEVRMRFSREATDAFIAQVADPASRVEGAAVAGLVMDDFATLFVAAPIPFEIEADAQLRSIYEGALVEQSQPLVAVALERYEHCQAHEGPLEWRLFCRDRANRLTALIDGEGQIRTEELARLRDRARLETVGAPPPGPAACWGPPPGGPTQPVTGSFNRPVQVGVLGTLSAMAPPSPQQQPATIPGDLVVAVPPHEAFAQAPLEAAQRTTLLRAVERKLGAVVDGAVTRWRTASRITDRWRRELPCRAATEPLEAVRRAHPAKQVGELVFTCPSPDSCEVRVTVHPPHEAGGEVVATVVGAVEEDPLTTAAWAEAVRSMEVIGFGLDAPRIGERGSASAAFGPSGWAPEMAALEEALAACSVEQPLELGVLYRIGARGGARITTNADDLPECVTSAIRSQEFDAGEERAVTFAMRLEPRLSSREQAYGRELRDGVRARVSGLAADPALNDALARCQLDHGSDEGAVGVSGTLSFGAGGTGEGAELTALGASTSYTDCVRQALLGVVDECGAHDRSVVICTYGE